MSDLYEEKNIAPMLIGASGEAFDSPDYIYELKLDGGALCRIFGSQNRNRVTKQKESQCNGCLSRVKRYTRKSKNGVF